MNEELFTKLCYPDYWKKPYILWRDAESWDYYFFKKNPGAAKHESRDALAAELNILIQDLEPDTDERNKALLIKSKLKKNPVKRKNKQSEKENFLSSKNNKATITLFCLQKGDEPLSAFPIEIKSRATVDNLKEAIKEKLHVPTTKDLCLWKVEISDSNKDELLSIRLDDKDRLLPTRRLNKIFTEVPAEEHIHIMVSSEKFKNGHEPLNQLYEFDVLVSPKRTKSFRWIANIEQVTLRNLKESIFAIYKTSVLENNGAILNFMSDGGKYFPQNDMEFCNMLQLFVKKNHLKFTVNIETLRPFSDWTFAKMCRQYNIGEIDDPSLNAFPNFNCKCMDLDNQNSKLITEHLVTDLRLKTHVIPISRNEASRSLFVSSYLVAAANLFPGKFEVRPEKYVAGPNGHGLVDYGLVMTQTSKLVGITEVKNKDFLQGIAQNAVQCESSLSNDKQKVFGIITDAEKWYFLECTLNDSEDLDFKLSKPVIVMYEDRDMENMISTVLGHI
ncbi:crinkler family protein [Gigaspora margarita]|uniref:Crinkler family protein n=1 Tax=Gigaspora margarita TaxID=4874 RepID=A0A8H4APL2_GIGMA|nr:crinkler family protein [Gigaspora margarita]